MQDNVTLHNIIGENGVGQERMKYSMTKQNGTGEYNVFFALTVPSYFCHLVCMMSAFMHWTMNTYIYTLMRALT